jgi:uncharacterized protein HemY
MLIIAWSIVRGFRLQRSHAQLGGLAGLVAIGTHQLADFSLELLGVAVLGAATLGAVADSVAVGFEFSLRKLCMWISVLCLMGAAVALSLHGRDVFTLEMRSRVALEENNHAKARELVRTGLSLHHSEPIFALTGAEVAVREGDASAGRWINRAQDLAPQWSAPHLLAARWLFSLGETDQALVEIRQAESLKPGSARMTICSLLRGSENSAVALRAAPEGADGAKFLDRAALCVPLRSSASVLIDQAARELDPNLPGPAIRQARRLLAAHHPLEAIDLLRELPAPDVADQLVLAEAYVQADDWQSAARTIAPLLKSQDVSAAVLRTAASIFVTTGNDEELRRVSSRMRGATGGHGERLADVELFLGRLYESERRYALALRSYEDSNRASESREALVAVARVAEAMGNRERALLTYRRLCRLDGGEGAACSTTKELEKPEKAGP